VQLVSPFPFWPTYAMSARSSQNAEREGIVWQRIAFKNFTIQSLAAPFWHAFRIAFRIEFINI